MNKNKLKLIFMFYGFQLVCGEVNRFFSTMYMKFIFLLSNIRLKGRCSFYGVTYTRFHPTAKVEIGENCTFRSSFSSNTIGIKQKCFLSAGKNALLMIGKDCGLSGTVINAEYSINIGDRVFFGANVTVCDSDRHPVNADARFENKPGISKAVIIEDDVWLGMNVVVMKGVTIGRGSVIAANSVVLKDIPSNVIAAGIPAIKIKNI